MADHMTGPSGNDGCQRGQSIVIVALAMVVLVGFLGLAIDGGRDMVDRRALQTAADTASDAAMRMLVADYHAEIAGQADTFPAGPASGKIDIKGKVDSIVTYAATAQSGLSAYTAIYVDSSGNQNGTLTIQGGSFGSLCKAPGQVNCTAGVKITPNFSHATTVFGALGAPTATEAALSASAYKITGPVPEPFSFWSVWNWDCLHGGAAITVGSDVTFHVTNGWDKHNSDGPDACGDGTYTPSGNASFKGFLGSPVHNCDGTVATVVSVGSCLDSTSGNGTKPGDIPLLHSKIYMFPIFNIDDASDLHVSGFAAVQPDSDGGDTGTVIYFCAAGSNSTVCIPGAGAPVSVTSGFLQ
jgi:Flp pilus assembly protein TadG